jgi:glycosyltransferase involved in cell wall biosynthesis
MPTYETPECALRAAINSVRNQLYPRWELCIADDASQAEHVPALLRQAAASDPRIKWVQRDKDGHIPAASNSALSLATAAIPKRLNTGNAMTEAQLEFDGLSRIATSLHLSALQRARL